MATFYNLKKREDRDRLIADRQDEMAAIDHGNWPRDTNDIMRWGCAHFWPTLEEQAKYARSMCAAVIRYVRSIEARIEAGDLDWKEV